jgi:hypothetical protein
MPDFIDKSVIDKFSFQLGMINCFAEMVACGVKKLAISPPLLPSQYETIAPYSKKIVEGFAIESYLENSLLITLLQSPEFTRGKCSILYYKSGAILETYLELKARQAALVESGRYDVQDQEEISIAFMELLTYPPEVIRAKLAGSHPDPFLIIEP